MVWGSPPTRFGLTQGRAIDAAKGFKIAKCVKTVFPFAQQPKAVLGVVVNRRFGPQTLVVGIGVFMNRMGIELIPRRHRALLIIIIAEYASTAPQKR